MLDLGQPFTPLELRLKVVAATQIRETPWSACGMPKKGGFVGFAVDTQRSR